MVCIMCVILLYLPLIVHCEQFFDLEEIDQGDTIILKHTNYGSGVKWYGPSYDSIDSKSNSLTDAYGRKTSWNTTLYTNNNLIHSGKLISDVLSIVGNHGIGEYYLQIRNMTKELEGLYYCDVQTNNGTISNYHNRVVLQIKDNNKLKIDYDPSPKIKEGGSITMCCSSKRLLPHENLTWFNHDRGELTRSDVDDTCLTLTNVSRNDYTTFTCLANGGTASKQTTINIMYPPVVEIWHSNDDSGKLLRCKAEGNPKNYTYKMWKHLSLYNEHIRDINSPGILRFGLNDGSAKWNQDDGYYICRVSNGIRDKDGKLFQTAIETVASESPPVFVADNKPVQYNDGKEPTIIIVNVLNISALNCTTCDLATQEHDSMVTIVNEVSHVTSWDIVHGRKIRVNGTKITYSIFNGSFDRYIVSVCDRFGKSSYEVKLRPSGDTGIDIATVLGISGTSILGTFFTVALLVFCASKNKQREIVVSAIVNPGLHENADENQFNDSSDVSIGAYSNGYHDIDFHTTGFEEQSIGLASDYCNVNDIRAVDNGCYID